MPTLHIANCTHQHQIANFRVIEETRVRSVTIPIGTQVAVPGNLSDKQIDGVIEQLRKYGAREVTEVAQQVAFIGLLYSRNGPVNRNNMEYAIVQNLEVLDEQGETQRAAAAVATHQYIENNMPRDERGRKPNLDELSVEVVEETPGTLRSGIDVPHKPVAAGVRVNREEGNTAGADKPITAPRKPRQRSKK